MIGKMLTRLDSWINEMSGSGTEENDKRAHGRAQTKEFTEDELEEIFRADNIAQRIVNRPVDEAFRKGFEIQWRDKSQAEALNKFWDDECDRLKCVEKFKDSWKHAMIHGGTAIIFGYPETEGQESDKPLRSGPTERITYMREFNRWELASFEINQDIMSDNYNLPDLYHLAVASVEDRVGPGAHWSRVLRFDGVKIPRQSFIDNDRWHDSVFQKIEGALKDYNLSHQGLASLIDESSIGVFKMSGLGDALAEGHKETVLSRMDMINLAKSSLRMMVLDAETESFDRAEANVGQVAAVMDKIDARMVAAADMPHNLILGDGARGGLGANGEVENRDWYDYIETLQTDYVKHRLYQLIDRVFRQKQSPTGGQVPGFDIKFHSLWQMTDDQKATRYLKVAQADQIYLTHQVLGADEIREMRFKDNGFAVDISLENEAGSTSEGEDELAAAGIDEMLKGILGTEAKFDSFMKQPGIDLTVPEEIRAMSNEGIKRLTSGGLSLHKIPYQILALAQGGMVPPNIPLQINTFFQKANAIEDTVFIQAMGGKAGLAWSEALVKKMREPKNE